MAGDIRYDVGVSVGNALRNLSTLSDKIQKVGEDFDGLASASRNAAAVLTAALGGLITSAASFADQMADVAAANETSIASVLGLSAAMQAAGGNADSVGRLFQSLSNNIDAANGGNMKMVETFGRLGISIQDLGSMGQDQIRNNLIKAIAEIQDPAERSAKAVEVFGKAAMGMNFKQLAADIEENTSKYAQYEENIKLAADAFDTMASIIKDLKIAATIAFEPLFKYVKDLKPNMDLLVTVIRALAAALGLAVGASVLAGFAKLIALVKTLTVVARANPIIAIASAVLGIAGAMGVLDTATTSVEESQAGVTKETEKTAEKVEKVKRDQSGINDAIQKQRDTLSQVREQFERQLQNVKDKVKFEGDALKLSEEQKKIAEQINGIEQNTQNALISLKQKYEAMDAPARKARQADYQKERELILQNSEATKKAVEQNIGQQQRFISVIKDLQATSAAYNDIQIQLFENSVKSNAELQTINDKIASESKLIEITKIRAALMAQTAGLSEEEKAKVIDVISIATTQTGLLKKNYEEINAEIAEYIKIQGEQGVISQETAAKILAATEKQRSAFAVSAGALTESNRYITEQARTFQSGWTKAFNEYIDNATNAAQIAQNIFRKATQGMEDLIVGFAKTGKFEFKNFVASMAEELLRSQVRQLMSQLFQVGGAKIGGGGGLLGGSIIPGILAGGGPVADNRPYIVGEQGPELFIPNSAGQMVPNRGLTNASSVTYNINAIDAMSFKEMIARDPSFIHAVAMQGSKSIPARR